MPDSSSPFDEPDTGPRPRNWSRAEIDAAIAGLDRATRRFTGQVDAIARAAVKETPAAAPAQYPAPPAPTPSPPAPNRPPASDPLAAPRMRRFAGLDQDLDEAEREAREYLAQAKKRADSLVATMIGAVEREAGELRREAEEGIRARWKAVEQEADEYLENARRVADGMVSERQAQLGSLSDEILSGARDLTSGLEDAAKVRAQFEAFVRTLSETADRIAAEAGEQRGREATAPHDRIARTGDGAIAA